MFFELANNPARLLECDPAGCWLCGSFGNLSIHVQRRNMHQNRFRNRFGVYTKAISFQNRKFWEMRMVSAPKRSEIGHIYHRDNTSRLKTTKTCHRSAASKLVLSVIYSRSEASKGAITSKQRWETTLNGSLWMRGIENISGCQNWSSSDRERAFCRI